MIRCRRVLSSSLSQIDGKTTTIQAADIQEKRNMLRRRIESWQQIQAVYMPAVVLDGCGMDQPERLPLQLPSSILSLSWSSSCDIGLVDKERRIRLAQAEDALAELRRHLRISSGLWKYKGKEVGSSQQAMTRTRSIINRFKEKTDRCADRYRAARSALLMLDPGGDWKSRLLELEKEHIKGPGRCEDDPSEGNRELSWIWLIRRGDRADLAQDEPTDEEISDSQYSFMT
jgi:hypothetical protein